MRPPPGGCHDSLMTLAPKQHTRHASEKWHIALALFLSTNVHTGRRARSLQERREMPNGRVIFIAVKPGPGEISCWAGMDFYCYFCGLWKVLRRPEHKLVWTETATLSLISDPCAQQRFSELLCFFKKIGCNFLRRRWGYLYSAYRRPKSFKALHKGQLSWGHTMWFF